jgi:hypothetical protein
MAGTDRGGYGRMKVADSMYRAHRISYTLANGPIPAGLVLDHLCRDSSCVTPAHLEAVTNKENIQRGESGTFNASKTHCAQGHEFTQENTYRGPSGQRHCRACGRNRNRKRSAQKRNKESQ